MRLLLWGYLSGAAIVFYVSFAAAQAPASKEEPRFGLEKRISWTTSKVIGTPEPPPPYRVRRAFPKLKFDQPLFMIAEPDTDRMLVVQRGGKIFAFPNDPNCEKAELYLDTGAETTSITFHPKFRENGKLYTFCNVGKSPDNKDRISCYQVRRGPPATVDPKSEQIVFEWASNGHNGGDLAFGPDGMLYITAGDGTSSSDPPMTGQDLSDIPSSMVRIDVDHPDPGKGYSVPKDNPFLDMKDARPEIWAYGFRNPWRLSFDPATGNLWLGDIGQDAWEMIYLVVRGGNYGWSVQEGSHPFQPLRKRGPTPIVPPVVEHPHSDFRSIVGGFVYHGDRFADLKGAYIYGDHETGKIWGFRYENGKVVGQKELADSTIKLLCFAVDKAGELYVPDFISGEIFQLEPAPPTTQTTKFPTRLSETGLFQSVKDHVPAPGLIAYSVNSPLWSDNAHKERFLALPGDTKIDFHETQTWGFADGAVLVKSFALDTKRGDPNSHRRVETRLLVKHEGQWHGYSYAWNAEQTDAELVEASGRDFPLTIENPTSPNGQHVQTWRYPSRAECMMCHTRAAAYVLGFNTPQMNRNHDYGGTVDNQLRALDHIGIFSKRLEKKPAEYSRLPDPADTSIGLEQRARSYLAANCAHCHVADGGGNSKMALAFTTKPEDTSLFDVRPQHETFGVAEAKLVAAGHPERSILLDRITRVGPGRMPKIGSTVVDEAGAKLLREWITQMKPTDVKAK